MANWYVHDENHPLDRVILPRVVVPNLCTVELHDPHWTPYGQSIIESQVPGGLVAASIGDAVELKVLDHLVANATYSAPAPYLGLWTSALTDASTAATAGELTYS